MRAWKWAGNLRDDCTAIGHGLMLRAEMMDRGYWWWAVYADEGELGADQIDSSNEGGHLQANTGKEARKFAEIAADLYLDGVK
jgi:hypothetical protein